MDYVRVLFAGDPPTISRQPASEFTAFAGNTVFFAANANGVSLVYQWQRNETDLNDTSPRVSGSTANQLQVTSVEACTFGSYRCVVSNGPTPVSMLIVGPIQLAVSKYTIIL